MTGKSRRYRNGQCGTDNEEYRSYGLASRALERWWLSTAEVCDTYPDDGGAYVGCPIMRWLVRRMIQAGSVVGSAVYPQYGDRKVYLNAPSDGKRSNYEIDRMVKDGGGNYVSAPDA